MNPNGEINFSVTCWPGRQAASAMREVLPGQHSLVLFLDPVRLVVSQAPFPDGARELARWCRELSREAARLATLIDPDGDPAPPEFGVPRHYLVKKDPRFDEGDGAW
jgi:hypothetical protein